MIIDDSNFAEELLKAPRAMPCWGLGGRSRPPITLFPTLDHLVTSTVTTKERVKFGPRRSFRRFPPPHLQMPDILSSLGVNEEENSGVLLNGKAGSDGILGKGSCSLETGSDVVGSLESGIDSMGTGSEDTESVDPIVFETESFETRSRETGSAMTEQKNPGGISKYFEAVPFVDYDDRDNDDLMDFINILSGRS